MQLLMKAERMPTEKAADMLATFEYILNTVCCIGPGGQTNSKSRDGVSKVSEWRGQGNTAKTNVKTAPIVKR